MVVMETSGSNLRRWRQICREVPSCVHSGHVTYGIPELLIVTGLCIEVTFSFDGGCARCVLQYTPRALAGDLAHSRCSLNGFLMKK